MSKEQQDITAAQILQFAEDYCQKLDEVKRDQPYHLNIIEELHINENAHSRILAKLLQYKDQERKYVFLESLLEYINDKEGSSCDFSKINIVYPEITQEKDRIDVLIRNKDSAIIIENKICGAVDQDKQLSRYIDRIQKKEYSKDDIYIVYLTKYYQSPSSDTWSSKREESEYSARFLNLSYMYDILLWLKKELDILPCKEIELRSALEQYVNYLKTINPGDKMKKAKKLLEDFPNYIYDLIKSKIDDWNKDKCVKPFEDKNPQKYPLVTELSRDGYNYFLYIELSDDFDFVKCCLEKSKGSITKSKLPNDLEKKNISLKKENDRKYFTKELKLSNANLEEKLKDFKKIHDFFKEK